MATKRLKWFARGAAGLVILGITAILLLFEGIDYTPYLRSEYFAETQAQLKQQTNVVSSGPLEAGFGKALLTPTLNTFANEPAKGHFRSLPLAGYGGRKGLPASGTKDDLWVKAVALKVGSARVVLVSADLLIIPREVTAMIAVEAKKQLGLPREQIYFGATHTHASLGGWGEGMVAESFAGKFQPGVRVWLAGQFFSAIRDAVADMKPASFSHTSFQDPKHVKNRLVGELGRVDPEFSLLAFSRSDGSGAILGSYAAHATVLSSRNMNFSADYPGAWERAVERDTKDMAVFFAGGIGSHSPVAGGGTFEAAETMGRALADSTLATLKDRPSTNYVTLGCLGLCVALPEFHARVSDGVRLRPWVARKLLPVESSTLVQALRIDDVVWISTPCDFSGELALDIKADARRAGTSANITSFNGDYIGYIIAGKYFHMNGYEPRLMSFFGPTMGDYLRARREVGEFGCAKPIVAASLSGTLSGNFVLSPTR